LSRIERITAEGAAPAIGPYSHATRANGFVYISGQLALSPDGSGLLGDTTAEQTRAALENLKAVLDAAGCGLDTVVKTTIYLVDMDDFGEVNQVYAEYFDASRPARSCVQVAALPKGGRVEIEAVAADPAGCS
jgi:2-iminobutanoate/2-iminopropanoate deaminase